MKYKILLTVVVLVIICLVFQQIHIYELKEDLGKQVIRRIDGLLGNVQLAKSSINLRSQIGIDNIHELVVRFNEDDIKIETIYIAVLMIRQDLGQLYDRLKDNDELNQQLENDEIITLKNGLLEKLTKLEQALNMVKEELQDDPIEYYKFRYQDNNETMKKVEEILNKS